VSHYTKPNIPLHALRESQISFVYANSTQGVLHKDGQFSFFWKALDELPHKKKVRRGAYHLLTAHEDAAAQAGTLLKLLTANGELTSTDMPPVLDLEWDKTESGSVAKFSFVTGSAMLFLCECGKGEAA